MTTPSITLLCYGSTAPHIVRRNPVVWLLHCYPLSAIRHAAIHRADSLTNQHWRSWCPRVKSKSPPDGASIDLSGHVFCNGRHTSQWSSTPQKHSIGRCHWLTSTRTSVISSPAEISISYNMHQSVLSKQSPRPSWRRVNSHNHAKLEDLSILDGFTQALARP